MQRELCGGARTERAHTDALIDRTYPLDTQKARSSRLRSIQTDEEDGTVRWSRAGRRVSDDDRDDRGECV